MSYVEDDYVSITDVNEDLNFEDDEFDNEDDDVDYDESKDDF